MNNERDVFLLTLNNIDAKCGATVASEKTSTSSNVPNLPNSPKLKSLLASQPDGPSKSSQPAKSSYRTIGFGGVFKRSVTPISEVVRKSP